MIYNTLYLKFSFLCFKPDKKLIKLNKWSYFEAHDLLTGEREPIFTFVCVLSAVKQIETSALTPEVDLRY